ncbi:hypothetical protein BX666DRAFT_2031852 [Dichotomocladium elegans]|nr:hypothetical protein BX666DRAFT_2031852 [Dichotomocladium elegans]
MEGIQNFGRRLARGLASWRNLLSQIDTPTYEELATAITKTSSEIFKSLHFDLKATLIEKLVLIHEIETEKYKSNIQIQALIDKKEEAEAELDTCTRKSTKACSKWDGIKAEHAAIIEELEDTIVRKEQKQHEMIVELLELWNQQEPESGLEYGQGWNTSDEEGEVGSGVASETEFDRYAVMDLDEQSQSAPSRGYTTASKGHQSTLFKYQERYPTLALLDEEDDQIEDALFEIIGVRHENARLKRENERLTQRALKWEIALGRADLSSSVTPKQVIREYLHNRESCRQAEVWVKLLEFELWINERNECNLAKTVDDLKNKVSMLREAKYTAEMEKEALMNDKRMLQMHRDLLDGQLIIMTRMEEARLGSDNNNIKYSMTKRIEELQELFENFQEEAEKARHEAFCAKLLDKARELQENPTQGEQSIQTQRPSLQMFDENGERLQYLTSNSAIGKRRRNDSGDDVDNINLHFKSRRL